MPNSTITVREGIPLLSDGRIAALDGLCAISTIIIALIFHYTHFSIANVAQYPFYNHIGFLYHYGYLAVEMFFMISGFKFAVLYGNKIAEGQITFSTFMHKRMIRLWPLFVATCLITQLLQLYLFHKAGHFFLHGSASILDLVLSILGVSTALNLNVVTTNGPAWTLALEMAMYPFFFAAMKLGKNKNHRLIICYALLLVGLTIQLSGVWWPLINGNLARGLISFFIGVLCYEFQRRQLISRRLVCLVIGAVMINSYGVYKIFGSWIFGDIESYMRLLILPCIFLLCLNLIGLARFLSCGIFSYISKVSYSMYLIHFPVEICIAIFFATIGKPINSQSHYLFFTRAFLIIIATLFTYYFIEKPIDQKLRKLIKT